MNLMSKVQQIIGYPLLLFSLLLLLLLFVVIAVCCRCSVCCYCLCCCCDPRGSCKRLKTAFNVRATARLSLCVCVCVFVSDTHLPWRHYPCHTMPPSPSPLPPSACLLMAFVRLPLKAQNSISFYCSLVKQQRPRCKYHAQCVLLCVSVSACVCVWRAWQVYYAHL